jgi:hypothetical protein
MKIWLINPYGPIPGERWRDYRFTILGRELARRGHSVCWWTGNFSHHFKRFRSADWRDLNIISGFIVRLVPSTSYNRNISLARIRFETIFARNMYRRAIDEVPPNLIIGTDPPQIVGYASVRLANRFRIPLIVDIFDLWPELFKLAFPRPSRFLAPICLFPFFFLRKRNLLNASGITALCHTYLHAAMKVAPIFKRETSLTVFNGIDVYAFRQMSQTDGEKQALANKIGIYSSNPSE